MCLIAWNWQPGSDTPLLLIRIAGTQSVVNVKDLQVLQVDRAFPLLGPQKPQTEIVDHATPDLRFKTIFEGDIIAEKFRFESVCNSAPFQPIPLCWTRYGLSVANGKLCAAD